MITGGSMSRFVLLLAALAAFGTRTAVAQETFTHELVTMVLPKGWAVQPSNPEPDLIVALQGAGKKANAIVMGSTEYGDLNNAMQKGREIVGGALPGAVGDTSVLELQTAAGDKMLLQRFTATMTYGGKDVALAALVAVTVNGKRGIIAQVYFPANSANQVGREFDQLIRSIK
jgi:hypothetical protein